MLSSASLRRATADLEQTLSHRDPLDDIAKELARDSADPHRRDQVEALLGKPLTVRDQKGGGTLLKYGMRIQDIAKTFPKLWPYGYYVPDAPGSAVPVENRYRVQWVSPDPEVTPGIGPVLHQFRDASKTIGYIGVANPIPASARTVGARGYAQAAIGVLYRPRHALSRVTFVPEAQYRYEWIIQTKHTPGTPTPRMRNTGWLRLIALRLDPVS